MLAHLRVNIVDIDLRYALELIGAGCRIVFLKAAGRKLEMQISRRDGLCMVMPECLFEAGNILPLQTPFGEIDNIIFPDTALRSMLCMLSGTLQSGRQMVFFESSCMNITVIGVPFGTGKTLAAAFSGNGYYSCYCKT